MGIPSCLQKIMSVPRSQSQPQRAEKHFLWPLPVEKRLNLVDFTYTLFAGFHEISYLSLECPHRNVVGVLPWYPRSFHQISFRRLYPSGATSPCGIVHTESSSFCKRFLYFTRKTLPFHPSIFRDSLFSMPPPQLRMGKPWLRQQAFGSQHPTLSLPTSFWSRL